MDNFIQITVFCPNKPRVGAFVYRNVGKVYKLPKNATCDYDNLGHLDKVDQSDHRKITIHPKKVGCGPKLH